MITLITATCNAATTLKESLSSVSSQTFHEVQHIIIDGESIDATISVASRFPHISRIVSEPDNGVYDAMNKGIRLAEGEIVGILNADDFYSSSDVLGKVVKVFENPAIDACYGDLVYVDYSNTEKIVRRWKSGAFEAKRFYWGWMPPHPTFFVRRSVYERYGLFNLELGSAADYEIMLRFLVKHKVNAAYISEVLVKMRTGGVSNASWRNRLIANRMDRKAWQVNGLKPYPWTLYMKPLRKISQWVVK